MFLILIKKNKSKFADCLFNGNSFNDKSKTILNNQKYLFNIRIKKQQEH